MILFCDGICLIAGFSQIEKKQNKTVQYFDWKHKKNLFLYQTN